MRRPRDELEEILRLVGVPIHRRSVRHAARHTSRRRMIEHQRRVPVDTWDPTTLIHWNHIDV
jgi:hypothetical protein